MLPFFRKIRWQLAKDNQFLKYGRYAIGEIVLVVIGILIALQINNWNEEKKEHEIFLSNLRSMRNDLISDTLGFNDYIEFLEQSSQLKEVLLREDSFDEYTLDSLIVLIQPFTDGNEINTKSYEKIDWSSVKRDASLDSLVSTIQHYYIVRKSRHDGNVEWDIAYAYKEAEYWYFHKNFEQSYLESVDIHIPYLRSDSQRLSDLKTELQTIEVRNLIRMAIYRKNWVKRTALKSKSEATKLLTSIEDYLESTE
jgi:hypothetical protein